MGVRRGRTIAVVAAIVIGVSLLALAASRARLLVPIASRWMMLGSAISRVTTPVILTIIYLVVFTPMAWFRRTFGRSPIAREGSRATYWVRRPDRTPDEIRHSMKRQF
jgi:hypothetical protein